MALLATPDPLEEVRPHGGRSLTRRLMLAALSGLALPAHAENTSIEYAVKAAYLCKFAPFVEWPASAFASSSSPFYLCILGDDPFGALLDQAASGQRVGDHPVVLRRLKQMEGAQDCHILYAGGTSKQSAAEALRHIRGAPVLTITDRSRGGSGGIIQFVVQGGRVRFEVDVAAAAANQVTISSKLLNLALSVRSRG